MKRPIFLSICVLLALSFILCACSNGAKDSHSQGDNSGKSSEGASSLLDQVAQEYELPIVKEPFTLTFATAEDMEAVAASKSYAQTLPAFEELEKRTGIHVKFEVVTPDQYNTTIQTRLAAGKDLPDLIRLPDDPIRYAKGGLIIPIDGLIGEHAPNILSLFKERPEVMKASIAPDGNIYTLSAVVDARSMVNFDGLGMRKDWLEKLIMEFLVLFSRSYMDQYTREEAGEYRYSQYVYKALEYIEQNYTQGIMVEEIATYIGLSTDYFSRMFKQFTGLTPVEYIKNVRLAKAAELLRQPEVSIAHVAMEVGFEDPGYFSRQFKQVLGMSPSKFQRENSVIRIS